MTRVLKIVSIIFWNGGSTTFQQEEQNNDTSFSFFVSVSVGYTVVLCCGFGMVGLVILEGGVRVLLSLKFIPLV